MVERGNLARHLPQWPDRPRGGDRCGCAGIDRPADVLEDRIRRRVRIGVARLATLEAEILEQRQLAQLTAAAGTELTGEQAGNRDRVGHLPPRGPVHLDAAVLDD